VLTILYSAFQAGMCWQFRFPIGGGIQHFLYITGFIIYLGEIYREAGVICMVFDCILL
jgi:hypothetical protein